MMRLVTFAVLAASYATTAAAHHRTSRELVLQLDEHGLVALFRVQLVGHAARLAVAAWDRDRDGVLGPAERTGAAMSLLARAVPAVTLSWDGEPLRPVEVVPRFTRTGERGAVVEGLLRFEVPDAGRPHTLQVGLAARAAPFPVQIQALAGWQLVEPAADGRVAALVLAPGREVEVKVVAVTSEGKHDE